MRGGVVAELGLEQLNLASPSLHIPLPSGTHTHHTRLAVAQQTTRYTARRAVELGTRTHTPRPRVVSQRCVLCVARRIHGSRPSPASALDELHCVTSSIPCCQKSFGLSCKGCRQQDMFMPERVGARTMKLGTERAHSPRKTARIVVLIWLFAKT